MDDYAMGLFLAAKRDIESTSSHWSKYLCLALKRILEDEGMEYAKTDPLEIFPQFAATYDGKHFYKGMIINDYFQRSIHDAWWHPSEDPVPRIAMIDFLVGK